MAALFVVGKIKYVSDIIRLFFIVRPSVDLVKFHSEQM